MSWSNLNVYGNDWRAELKVLKEQEEYAAFLEKLSEVVKDHAGEINADLMYDGAWAYFMLGDYDRATSWVDSCLNLDGGHLKARLLLGRICILEERTEDALALFEMVLENGADMLSVDDREDIATISSYYARKDEEHTKEAYPYLAVLLGFLPADAVANHQEGRKFLLGSENSSEHKGDIMTVAEAQLTDILSQKISLRDKVKLLEVTAGGFYTEGAVHVAERILAAALTLDPLDNNLLRNMALVQKEIGNKEKALRFAAQMPQIDFLLLRTLKE